MDKKILVIIPAFNEEETVGRVIDSIRDNFSEADILVVNDGSSDLTGEISRRKSVFVIDLPFNMGIGSAMQTGFKFAQLNVYDIAVQVDADGQHEAVFIRKLIQPLLKNEVDLVIGSRFRSDNDYKSTLPRGIGIKLLSFILSLILGKKVTDTTSGFRAVNKRGISFLAAVYPDDFPEVEAILLSHKFGLSFLEIPVSMSKRKGGASSITPLRSIYYMIKVLLAVFILLFRKENSGGNDD